MIGAIPATLDKARQTTARASEDITASLKHALTDAGVQRDPYSGPMRRKGRVRDLRERRSMVTFNSGSPVVVTSSSLPGAYLHSRKTNLGFPRTCSKHRHSVSGIPVRRRWRKRRGERLRTARTPDGVGLPGFRNIPCPRQIWNASSSGAQSRRGPPGRESPDPAIGLRSNTARKYRCRDFSCS